jgi:hypothetical protein
MKPKTWTDSTDSHQLSGRRKVHAHSKHFSLSENLAVTGKTQPWWLASSTKTQEDPKTPKKKRGTTQTERPKSKTKEEKNGKGDNTHKRNMRKRRQKHKKEELWEPQQKLLVCTNS